MENNERRKYKYEIASTTGEPVQFMGTAPAYPPEWRLLIDTANRIYILNDKELDAFEELDLHIGPDGDYFTLKGYTDVPPYHYLHGDN